MSRSGSPGGWDRITISRVGTSSIVYQLFVVPIAMATERRLDLKKVPWFT
jgi:hypothetical protein